MRYLGRQSPGWAHTREFREGKYAPVNNKEGKCVICGVAFRGGRNRKYCDEHSKTIKFRGRSVDGL